jgi:hypothetical protein
MNKKKTIDKIIGYSILAIGICCLSIFMIKGYTENHDILENKEYNQAKIIDIYRIRYSDYCKYSFHVKASIYYGTGKYYAGYGNIGDSIKIVYNKTNPSNNKTEEGLKNYNTLKILSLFVILASLLWWRFRKY